MLPLGLPPLVFPLGLPQLFFRVSIYWKRVTVCASAAKLYRPRNPEASPFYKLVRAGVTISTSSSAFMTSGFSRNMAIGVRLFVLPWTSFSNEGDLREGFARVRCPDCCKAFFVAFSCRQRCCCPSCDQKRVLLPGMRLAKEVFAPVGHRQWVLTMPKRLRIFFRNDRRLLGKLCRLAHETIRDGLRQACRDHEAEPGFVGAVQTFGDLINWHSHVHAIVSEGLFKRDGFFIRVVKVDCNLSIAYKKMAVTSVTSRAKRRSFTSCEASRVDMSDLSHFFIWSGVRQHGVNGCLIFCCKRTRSMRI